MAGARKSFLIAQVSDIHCGDPRFDEQLMKSVIEGVNRADPDLLIVGGDLTMAGYRDEYDAAREYLSNFACPQRMVIAGNHDQRNVGYLLFEEMFGPRWSSATFSHRAQPGGKVEEFIKVVSVDSNKPDLDDGEVGRQNYNRIRQEFCEEGFFKVFVLHHHLIHIPGTGRERNIVWDAGDVLETLLSCGVHMSLSGHKHVPYVWALQGLHVVTSGTAGTHRTRGYTPPSFNLIEVFRDRIIVSFIFPETGEEKENALLF